MELFPAYCSPSSTQENSKVENLISNKKKWGYSKKQQNSNLMKTQHISSIKNFKLRADVFCLGEDKKNQHHSMEIKYSLIQTQLKVLAQLRQLKKEKKKKTMTARG